jgi:hypothetical protein
VPRREVVPASLAVLLCASWGCATGASNATGTDESGRTLTRGKPTSGYEVRESAEASDTDGLQISLDRGVIPQEAAQEAVMKRWQELTRCYGEAGPAMGFAGGAVTLRFLVDGGGAVTEVRILETRLGSFAVERCLLGVGRTVRFPRPHGNATAQVDYTLEFRSTGAIGVMELAPEELAPELTRLYTRLAGECERLGADALAATLYIDAAGTIRSVGLASEGPVDEEAAGCVAAALRRFTAKLASVQGGLGRVTVPLFGSALGHHRGKAAAELRSYSRASTPPRARPRRGRVRR